MISELCFSFYNCIVFYSYFIIPCLKFFCFRASIVLIPNQFGQERHCTHSPTFQQVNIPTQVFLQLQETSFNSFCDAGGSSVITGVRIALHFLSIIQDFLHYPTNSALGNLSNCAEQWGNVAY